MNKISLVVITLNEEKKLAACLSSAKEAVDEMVVVDSFSTDQTVAIARKFGAKVVEKTFTNYIDQKNFANAQAENDFILSLDADEVLSPVLQESILSAKRQWQADGYEFNRLTNYCGSWIRHCGWYPDRKVRLFDRKKFTWDGKLIHETLKGVPGVTVKRIKGDLLHYSYDSLSGHLLQLQKFTETGARDAIEKGRKANLFLLVFSPLFKFVKAYFLQLGFLDGVSGFLVCAISSFASFMKYAHMYYLQNKAQSK